ncbi:hypothetical protein ABS642_05170 [Microbacterium sp. A8/3-1]|uniref:Uncharacterized protein n=1 Tax=Microbacterium sp. A8/3-1 TaxID=3160749 RepID=A0AAU7VYK0_9MICO
MSADVRPTISGVGRVVSVGGSLTWDIPYDAEVVVQPTFTLVRSREGRVYRLVERGGEVREAPLNTEQRSHALTLFSR